MSLRTRILIFLGVVVLAAVAPRDWTPWPLVVTVAAYVVLVLTRINQ